jgi:peptide-methionine (S)-S-oxide reductase
MSPALSTAVFANGCFWCTEAVFQSLKGVKSVTPGYTGGKLADPTYEQVCEMDTGHAEAIRIEYDSAAISYDDLLAVFFNTHDPTTLNRQGNDVGTQYRSAIFYADSEQERKASALISELNASKAYDKPVVTEVASLGEFYPAEDYHRNYYENNKTQPYCQLVIAPKLEKLQKRFAKLLA